MSQTQTSNQIQTPNQTQAQRYKRIDIDLRKLYNYLEPSRSAATMLKSILRNYVNWKIVAVVNFSPDFGGYAKCRDKKICREIEKIINSDISEDEAVEKIAKMLNVDIVVTLNDGYEYAVAFIEYIIP